MDVDALVASRKDSWDRLQALAVDRRLTGAEVDELIERYQEAGSDLSELRSHVGSNLAADRLSVILSTARLRITGTAGSLLQAVPRLLLIDVPAALYRVRWFALGAAVFTVTVGALFAIWALGDPLVLATYGDEQTREAYQQQFVDYYSENPAASFAGQVWTNNALIAALCIALGITGVGVPAILIQNAAGLGTSVAVLLSEGNAHLLQYLLPHGLLELTAVFWAAGAGMLLFWRLLVPGTRTRGQALAEEGRAIFVNVLGLAITLFVSWLIEAFITPAPLPWPLKIGIGVLALAAFLFIALFVGRRAAQRGSTGDLTEADAGARRLVAG